MDGLGRQIGRFRATKKEDRRNELIKSRETGWEVCCDKKEHFSDEKILYSMKIGKNQVATDWEYKENNVADKKGRSWKRTMATKREGGSLDRCDKKGGWIFRVVTTDREDRYFKVRDKKGSWIIWL